MDLGGLPLRDILTPELAKKVLAQAHEVDDASALLNQNDPPFSVQVVTIDLTTARSIDNPYVIGFGYRSVFVRTATDATVAISLRPYSTDGHQGDIEMHSNDSLVFPERVPKGFLTWSAQSGKSVTLVFFLTAEFRSGSQISSTAGGVSVTTGTAMTPQSPVAVSSTATAILSSDSTRKNALIGNPRGSGVDMWISGTNAVTDESGAKPGYLLEPGDYYEFKGQGALYGITTAGTVNATIQTES